MEKYIKINIDDYFIKNLNIYKAIENLKENIHSFVDKEEILDVLNSINFGVPGAEEDIIAKHLIRLGKRAIELNDPELLDILCDLQIVAKD